MATLQTLDYSVLQQCMHCGMCLPTCPTYDATKRERNSPRGRIALMRAIADGELEVSRDVCRRDELLPRVPRVPDGVSRRRELRRALRDRAQRHRALGHQRGAGAKLLAPLTLGFLFRSPRAMRTVGALTRVYQRSGLEAAVRTFGLTMFLPATLRRLEPQTPRMASAFSNRLIAPIESPRGEARYRVALLTGCIQDLVFSDVNRDTADVLLANGCAVDTPPSSRAADRCTPTTASWSWRASKRAG